MLKRFKYHVLFFSLVLIVPIDSINAKDLRQKKKNKQNLTSASKSFVKVFRELTILKCKKNKKCVTGVFKSTGSGSSVLVHEKYNTVLTAGHMCVPNITVEEFGHVDLFSMSITVLNYRKEVHPAEIISKKLAMAKNDKTDLCMLYVHDLKIPKLKFSSSAPRIGDQVFALSAPGGVYHPPIVPIFSGVFSGDINHSTSLVTVSSSPGSSGGPVISSSYEVIGVIFAVFIHNKQITLMNNHKITKNFIKSVKDIIDLYEKKSKNKSL